MLFRQLKNTVSKGFSIHQKKISFIPGESVLQSESNNVELRGLHIHGAANDLPPLIFFVDCFD